MSTSDQHFAPGTYKFTVQSADQAVALIREKLGPTARVLSVRSVEATGLKKFFTAPRLEVVAQVAAPATAAQPEPPVAAVSQESQGIRVSEPTPPAPNRLAQLPPSIGLTGLLRRSGITETALDRLQAGVNWPELSALP